MEHGLFVARVQREAGLASPDDAERAVRATLGALAQRLEGAPAFMVASQIPGGVRDHLVSPGEVGPRAPSYDDFLRVVGEREGGVAPEEAAGHARAVVSVLDEAVSGVNIGFLRAQLPDDFDPLFQDD